MTELASPAERASLAILMAEHRLCWRCGASVPGQFQLCPEHQANPFTWNALDDLEMEFLNSILFSAVNSCLARLPFQYSKMRALEVNSTLRELRALFLEQSAELLKRPCAGG